MFDWLLKNGLISCLFRSLNSKSWFPLDFHLYVVEDNPEINLFTTCQFRNVLFLKIQQFEFTNCHLRNTRFWNLFWLKCVSLFLIIRSLNVRSVVGDVFILMCTVTRLKSKHFRGKVNSRRFWWFLTASRHARAIIQPEPEFSGSGFRLFQSLPHPFCWTRVTELWERDWWVVKHENSAF